MIEKNLNRLRELLLDNNYAGYIISTADEYLGEYTPGYAKRLMYITGFTGSNGLAIILTDTVLFFTDGRYLDQAFKELDDHIFEIFDQKLLIDFPWRDYIKENDILSYDPKIFSRRTLKYFKKIRIKAHIDNFIDKIWDTQPLKPSSIIYDYSSDLSGEDYRKKVNKCRTFLSDNQAEALLINNPDSVCWLLNIRAHDIEYSPLLLAYLIVTKEKIYLFTDPSRYQNHNNKDIVILSEEKFEDIIKQVKGKILFDENLCSDYIASLVEQKNYQNITNPTLLWKAQKNATEIEKMQDGHINDAVAVCEVLAFIDRENVASLSEHDISLMLTKERAKSKTYIMDSFPAICGYQDNGAIIHYRAEQNTAKKLEGDGLLLIDSGGQYLGATTDITRTIAIGAVNQKHRENYTKVLKGHIALGNLVFPEKKLTGANIDVLARQFLWQDGKDYAHGTGHGVGSFLNVHEGPQNISLAGGTTIISEGMVMSNEPGYYLSGHYGIRIENMMYVKKSRYTGFLEFDTLTLVPYAKELIIEEMLSSDELSYITTYYAKIKDLIYPKLSENAKTWFSQQVFL